jgi:hypothetical protein
VQVLYSQTSIEMCLSTSNGDYSHDISTGNHDMSGTIVAAHIALTCVIFQ